MKKNILVVMDDSEICSYCKTLQKYYQGNLILVVAAKLPVDAMNMIDDLKQQGIDVNIAAIGKKFMTGTGTSDMNVPGVIRKEFPGAETIVF